MKSNSEGLNIDIFLDFILDCFAKCSAVRDTDKKIVNFRIDYINSGACEFFNVSKEKFMENLLSDLIPLTQFSEIFDIFRGVVNKNSLFEKESLIYKDVFGKDKDKHLLNIRAIKQGDGFIVVWRDLTALGLDASQLEKSERQFRQMVTESADGIVIVDSRRKVLFVNYTAEKIFGKSAEEFLGTEFGYTVETDEAMEITIIRKDNTLTFAELKAVKIPWEGSVASLITLRDITVRKNAEEALKTIETRYRNLFESMSSGVAVYEAVNDGEDFMIKDFNKAGEIIDNIDRKEVISKLVTEAFPGVKTNNFLNLFRRVWKTGKAEFFPQAKYVDERMGESWRENWVYKLLSGELVAIYHDITEKVKKDEASKEIKERYERVIKGSNDGMWEWNVRTNEVFFSERWKSMLGYQDHEIENDFSEWEKRVHPDGIDIFWKYIKKHLMSSDSLFELEHRLKHKDGSYKWILARAFTVRDSSGQALMLTGSHTDITKLRLAESEIRENQEKLSGIVSAIPDYMSLIDEDYNIIWANEHLEKNYGPDVVGKKCFEVFCRSSEPCEDCSIDRLLETGKIQYQERKTINSDGEVVYLMSVANVAAKHPDGRPKTVIKVSRDVTPQKSLEDQFRQSQKMESIGRLAGGIAHDFNNLLTVITGNTVLAMMELNENDPLMEDLIQVKKASEKASKLTRQLLAFSRKQEIQPDIVNLNDLIINMEKMLKRIITEDITLEADLSDKLWNIKVDIGQFESILVNLCVNAHDAMPDGGTLQIRTQNTVIDRESNIINSDAKEGDYVLLSVEDTGQGMTKEVMANIFEPFYTTKKEGEGTGLGLATVYGIVKQSSGFINVFSEPGIGSCFNIYIPKSKEEEREIERKVISETVLHGKETILIVEDDTTVRNIAVKILKKYGYNVIEAGNGDAGLLKCKKSEKPVDLIITDVIMPGISGKEFIQFVKEFWPKVKTLFMSGYTFDTITKKGIVESEVNFISKPFQPLVFVQKVREILDHKED